MNSDMHGGRTVAAAVDDHGSGRRSLWKSPALVTALVLLIPLMGNLFVEGWNWPLRGFVFAGVLVFATALTYQLVTRKIDSLAYRAAVAMALVAAFLLFWVNRVQAADDVNPVALWYFVVLPVGIVGAAIARFRASGMARALFVTALVQTLVLTAVLMTRNPLAAWTPAALRGFGANAFFAMMFVSSALLFRSAGRGEGAA